MRTSRSAEFGKHALMWFVLAFAFYPLFLMFVVSFKTNTQFEQNPWFFDHPSTWQFGNWAIAWDTVRPYILNSVFVSTLGTAITMIMVTFSAYALARYKFPGKSLIYYGVLATMFLPGTAATLVTVFWLLRNMGFVNDLMGLVVMAAAGGQVVGIFILKQFVEDIPKELFESAQVDGAGHLWQVRHILLPLALPILATLTILDFLGSWNGVMLPLVLMRDDEKLTIPVGLLRLEGEYVKQWGQMMAGYSIAALPLVVMFLFTMRWFVRGLAAGAVKG
jgi:ABC-type glycerol-3-phosphate transport system permease component